MILVKIPTTYGKNGGGFVWINPEHVQAVDVLSTNQGHTYIQLAGDDSWESPLPVDEVVELLSPGSRMRMQENQEADRV
jgi:hypothetical protein